MPTDRSGPCIGRMQVMMACSAGHARGGVQHAVTPGFQRRLPADCRSIPWWGLPGVSPVTISRRRSATGLGHRVPTRVEMGWQSDTT
jgi:hypothetical protein